MTIKRLQSRLQKESDLIKQAALAAERKRQTTTPGTRTVQKGDYVWLVYSDKERARYRRKHGHGKAWKHAFVVEEVRRPKMDGGVQAYQIWMATCMLVQADCWI